jgi:hypothetical protein
MHRAWPKVRAAWQLDSGIARVCTRIAGSARIIRGMDRRRGLWAALAPQGCLVEQQPSSAGAEAESLISASTALQQGAIATPTHAGNEP